MAGGSDGVDDDEDAPILMLDETHRRDVCARAGNNNIVIADEKEMYAYTGDGAEQLQGMRVPVRG